MYPYIIWNSALHYESSLVTIILLLYRGVRDTARNGHLHADGRVYGESGRVSARNETLRETVRQATPKDHRRHAQDPGSEAGDQNGPPRQ